MKFLKTYQLFENKNSDGDFSSDIIMKQALGFNKPEMLEYAIQQGFVLTEDWKKYFIGWCEFNALYDSIHMLDPEHHKKLVAETTKLDFTGRGIKTMRLNTLSNLTNLWCNSNMLQNLKGIENLTNLTSLHCNNNEFSNLEDIKNLTNLRFLNCGESNITSFKGIEGLTNLRILYCDDAEINNLKGIENLTNLTDFVCTRNSLTDLEGIENLTNLTQLECSSNQLTSLKGIEGLTKLEKLLVFNNKLVSVKEIVNLPNLKDFDATYNQLPTEINFARDAVQMQNYYRNN